jgi:hypothetical protein
MNHGAKTLPRVIGCVNEGADSAIHSVVDPPSVDVDAVPSLCLLNNGSVPSVV